MSSILTWIDRAESAFGILRPLALLSLRLSVARLFLLSGLNKWTGFFQFNPTAYDLFLYEYFCPEPARAGALRLCDAQSGDYTSPAMIWLIERFANLAGIMEIALPVLLIIGLFTRTAALGLLAMTLFIQAFVFTGWSVWWGSHMWWTVVLLAIIATGPGRWSADRLILRRDIS